MPEYRLPESTFLGIEDEIHFVFVCESYIKVREYVFTVVIKEIPDFSKFDYEDRLRILLDRYHRKQLGI